MIRERVPDAAVEHVGGTAVPGCAGKGVIDLMIPHREGELGPLKLEFARRPSSVWA